KCSEQFGRFLQQALTVAGEIHSQGEEAQEERIVNSMRDLYASITKLMHVIKQNGGNNNNMNYMNEFRQQLASIVKHTTSSMNATVSCARLNIISNENNTLLYAQQECDNALRAIETTRTILISSVQVIKITDE